jgi:poly(A) polymerase
MIFFLKNPREQNLIREISKFAKKKKVKLYLVGGIVRDFILNREKENLDIDFCLKNHAISFAKALSGEIRAGFVLLDKEHGSCRLVKKLENKVYTLDFTDFKGKTLKDDLLHRDFTINAMSIELDKLLNARLGLSDENLTDLIIDPYHGIVDLKSKIIHIVNVKAFDEDPLRILRAFSLACIFGFKIDAKTIKLIKAKKDKLTQVSYERIRDELFKILDRPDTFKYLEEMDKLKVLEVILPEILVMRRISQGPYHHLDVWKHTLETIKQLDGLLAEVKKNKDIQDYLNVIVSGGRSRRALIKLGALLHDIGKPKARRRKKGKTIFHGHEKIGEEIAGNISRYLKLSNDESDALRKMVFGHLRPGYLADNEEITPRAIFRFFRDASLESVSILLLSIADQRSTRGPLTSKKTRIEHEKVALDLIKKYFKKSKEKKLIRIITGDDLIKEFKLEPSVLIGKMLREIEELQAIGKIRTKKEALQAAEKLLRKR